MLSTYNRTEMHEKGGSFMFAEYIQDLQEDVVSWLEIFGQFVSKKECVVCSVNIFVHKCVHLLIRCRIRLRSHSLQYVKDAGRKFQSCY